MSKFTMTLIAAGAAAIAAFAVVALPAIGDAGSKGNGKGRDPDLSAFAACLARHGLTGAPSTGRELKPWLGSKAAADPRGVKAAVEACQPSGPDSSAPSEPDVQSLITCLRSQGLDAPTAPDDLKRWVAEQMQGDSKAVDDALTACKMALAPDATQPAPSKPDGGAPPEKTGPRAQKPEAPRDTNGR